MSLGVDVTTDTLVPFCNSNLTLESIWYKKPCDERRSAPTRQEVFRGSRLHDTTLANRSTIARRLYRGEMIIIQVGRIYIALNFWLDIIVVTFLQELICKP